MPRAILQVHGEYKLIYSIKFKHKHLSFKHTTLPHIRTALQMSLWSSKHTLPQIDSVMRAKQDELIEFIRLNPAIRSCVYHMICEVVPK